jgi:hypothetical protein
MFLCKLLTCIDQFIFGLMFLSFYSCNSYDGRVGCILLLLLIFLFYFILFYLLTKHMSISLIKDHEHKVIISQSIKFCKIIAIYYEVI